MHAPGPQAETGWGMRWEAFSASFRLLVAPGDTEGPAHSLWCGRPPSAHRSLSPGFPVSLRPPARLSGALSRRRRCRTSVLAAAAAPEMPRARAGVGKDIDSPPSSSNRRVLLAFVEGRRYSAHPRGPLPGSGSRGRTEAGEPEGRFHGGRPPHFLRLPGGGAISAHWAKQESRVLR